MNARHPPGRHGRPGPPGALAPGRRLQQGFQAPLGVGGEEGGRFYSTSIMALCLEVYSATAA